MDPHPRIVTIRDNGDSIWVLLRDTLLDCPVVPSKLEGPLSTLGGPPPPKNSVIIGI